MVPKHDHADLMTEMHDLRTDLALNQQMVIGEIKSLTAQVTHQNGRIGALEVSSRADATRHARDDGAQSARTQMGRRDMWIIGTLIALIPTATAIVAAVVS